MRKTLATILVIVMTLTCMPLGLFGSSAMAATTVKAYVTSANGKAVNVREGAGKNYRAIAKLDVGTEVTVNGTEDEWTRIAFEGKEGYIQSVYLTSDAKAAKGKPTPTPVSQVKWIDSQNAGSVHIRKGPAKGTSSLGTLPSGTQVTVISVKNNWTEVKAGDLTGYVMTKYLSDTKPAVQEETKSAQTDTKEKDMYVINPTGAAVNVRSKATSSAKVIAKYDIGTKVHVEDSNHSWSRITMDGGVGYIMNRLLSDVKPDVVVTPAPSTTPAPEKAESRTRAWVDAKGGTQVHMRKKADKKSESLANYETGTEVTVLEMGKTWSKIETDAGTGYMMTTYLSMTEPDAKPETNVSSDVEAKTAWVTAANKKPVRVRSGASTKYGVVAQLDVGTPVTVYAQKGKWSQIMSGLVEGYIQSEFLTTTEPANPVEKAVWTPAIGSRVFLANKKGNTVVTREGPARTYAVDLTCLAGTPAIVREVMGDFLRVRINGEETFVALTNVAEKGAEALPNSTGRQICYLKNNSRGFVSVRKALQTNADVLGEYLCGTAVILQAQSDDGWSYIKIGGMNGYVNSTDLVRRY
ncbi:MAG: SH3 domain-containing protein [Clostridia bacterium]|nr:SH3 domain-containing protein [Clostridia bacterium]